MESPIAVRGETFTYASNGAKNFRVEAKDTEGHVFQRQWRIEDSGI